ncbi:MAG: hypothetical protein V1726_06330 [Methanobacteriota archaeon]
MVPWNALPWDTILTIIVVSILIPILLAIIFIKIKRYEDLGIAIGIFLLLLGTISYGYLIPYKIVNAATLPENYIWYDEGNIQYWERNNVFSTDQYQIRASSQIFKLFAQQEPIKQNFTGKEVIHTVHYDPSTNNMLIHDVIYDQNGDVLSVINGQEKVSEWYTINPQMTNLQYTTVKAGSMGIPANPSTNNLLVGWVDSNGEENGKENIVLVRTMQKIKEGVIDGTEVSVWQSDVFNKPITWHGETYVCDETIRLTVHSKTGYVIHVYRHLVLSAHLSQFIKLYYPDSLRYRIVTNYLKLNDPIGEAAELVYQTTEESQARHLADVREISDQTTYLPLVICVPMFVIGILLLWRYGGRSYYWKRYKKYDPEYLSSQESKGRWNQSMQKIGAILVVLLIIISSVGYALFSNMNKPEVEPRIPVENIGSDVEFQGEEPTPPGNERGIDAGRHILLPVDEGPHKLSHREWWYFNMEFNDPGSDLQNHSMIISFNKMSLNDIRGLKRDNLFIILYDDQGQSYNFGLLNKPRRTLKMSGPGVNLDFEGSQVTGAYPYWEIHVVDDTGGFSADLNFTADFMPVWVMGRSSNLPIARYFSGDYYVPRCIIEGTVTWNNKEYVVAGTGYHDHVWEGVVPRSVTKGWDWLNLHFENGWEMYLSKFNFRTLRDRYAGALIISPNNRNLVEYTKFTVDYLDMKSATNLASMMYPTRLHVEAEEDGMKLVLDIDITNTCELVWRWSRTGMFEGPCIATGTFTWADHTVELKGYGMSEITRVKYLLGLPNFLQRRNR